MSHRYFDGRVAKPHDVSVIIRPTEIEIVDPEGRGLAIWPMPHIRVADHNAVSGAYRLRLEPDRAERLELASGADLERLLAEQPQFARWRRREQVALLKGFALWGSAAAIVGVALYFSWTKVTTELAMRMPRSWEDKIGSEIEYSWFPESQRCTGAEGLKALRALGDRLWPGATVGSDTGKIQLFVLRDKDANAFAVPGHRIVVYSGLIDRAKSPEMVAGVLAHEMGHVELRHPIRGLIHQLGIGAVATLIFGDSTLASVGQLALLLSYSRDMEREADQRGIALLQQAGIRADGMAAFFEEFKKDGAGGLPDFLSTHPDLDARIAATTQPSTGAPAMSEAEWKALRAVCARE
jgi:Zn-dependent protease with chaperone function